MKLKIKKRSSEEWFFLVILFIYIVSQLVSDSTFYYILPTILFKIVRFGVLLGSTLSILVCKKYTKMYLMAIGSVATLLIVMFIFNEYFVAMAIPLLLVLASDVTDYKSTLKCIVLAIFFSTFFIMLSCALHILPDYTYPHKMGEIVKTAHSYGFKYYGTLGYIFMSLTAIYLYVHENISFFRLGVIALINYVVYLFHTTQLAIVVSTLLLIGYIFTRKIKLLNFNNKFWNIVSIITPSILCIGTVELVNLYKNNVVVLSLRFNTLTSRLKYSLQAINEYGISLFGTEVTMYGNTQKYYGNAKSGFYIDSGFLYSLIAYGIIFTILIVLIYTLIYKFIASGNDGFLFVWMSVILVACVVNNFLLSCHYNPLIFLLPYAIRHVFKNKRKKINVSLKELPRDGKCIV